MPSPRSRAALSRAEIPSRVAPPPSRGRVPGSWISPSPTTVFPAPPGSDFLKLVPHVPPGGGAPPVLAGRQYTLRLSVTHGGATGSASVTFVDLVCRFATPQFFEVFGQFIPAPAEKEGGALGAASGLSDETKSESLPK